jgi:hypothetical protein
METFFIEYPDRKFCSEFGEKKIEKRHKFTTNISKQEEYSNKCKEIFEEAHSFDDKTTDYLVFKRRRCNEN